MSKLSNGDIEMIEEALNALRSNRARPIEGAKGYLEEIVAVQGDDTPLAVNRAIDDLESGNVDTAEERLGELLSKVKAGA